MILSLPFLATKIEQIPYIEKEYGNQAIEAVIFNYEDLEETKWLKIWKEIEKIPLPKSNITFHFPVNNSDYVSNPYVYEKLKEAFIRSNDLGLSGIVVHSNRIRLINEWKMIDLDSEREKVINCLVNILNSVKQGNTWLGLENMPVMDNYGKEIDPIFVFAKDFEGLKKTDISIVWDFCHYSNSLASIQDVINKKQNENYYPNIQAETLEDVFAIKEKIKHIHFSAFDGVANPDTGTICKEGVLPKESTLGEDFYKKALKIVKEISSKNMHIVFEIQEKDYVNRKNSIQMIHWFKENFNDI